MVLRALSVETQKLLAADFWEDFKDFNYKQVYLYTCCKFMLDVILVIQNNTISYYTRSFDENVNYF